MYLHYDIDKDEGIVFGEMYFSDKSEMEYYVDELYKYQNDRLYMCTKTQIELGSICLNKNIITKDNYIFDTVFIMTQSLWDLLSDEEKNRTDVLYIVEREEGEI